MYFTSCILQEILELKKKLSFPVFMKTKSWKSLSPEACNYKSLTIEGGGPYAGTKLTGTGEFEVDHKPIDAISSPHHSVRWYRVNQRGAQILVAT